MTNRRYLSYRRALGWIDAIDEELAGPEPIRLLREDAEDLLLSRGAPAEVAELEGQVADTLRRLADLRVITLALAREIEHTLRAAGPSGRGAVEAGAALTP